MQHGAPWVRHGNTISKWEGRDVPTTLEQYVKQSTLQQNLSKLELFSPCTLSGHTCNLVSKTTAPDRTVSKSCTKAGSSRAVLTAAQPYCCTALQEACNQTPGVTPDPASQTHPTPATRRAHIPVKGQGVRDADRTEVNTSLPTCLARCATLRDKPMNPIASGPAH